MPEPWTGGCQCGAVRYEIEPLEVLTLYCCHCRECQRQAASGFGMSMLLRRRGFRLLRGALRNWSRPADSGGVNRANFCPSCGVRIFHEGGEGSAVISLKAGSLDDTGRLRPVGHIWTRSAQPWVHLAAGMLRYEGQPDTDDALIAAYRDTRD